MISFCIGRVWEMRKVAGENITSQATSRTINAHFPNIFFAKAISSYFQRSPKRFYSMVTIIQNKVQWYLKLKTYKNKTLG